MRNGGCLGLGWEGEVVAVNAQWWVPRSGLGGRGHGGECAMVGASVWAGRERSWR